MHKVSHELAGSLNNVQWLLGDAELAINTRNLPAFEPFDISIVTFLDDVSRQLRQDKRAREYPEVMTFAFWCRKASLMELKRPYQNDELRLGRGVAFHIAPSNVPVNFAYSLVTGLLSGNANVVRVPSKGFEQVDIIADAFSAALRNHSDMVPYICLCRYGHDKAVNDLLSGLCDVRVIWGGNTTIEAVRLSPLKPRAIELCFADRFSIAVINADVYVNEADTNAVAKEFFNDTYLTDQNACTSPRLIVWIGVQVKEAQSLFWSALHELVQGRYELAPVQAVNKLHTLCKQADALSGIKQIQMNDNLITRVELNRLNESSLEEYGHSGYFMEYVTAEIMEILPVCSEKCQTVSCYGIEPAVVQDFVRAARPRGIDRIVPLGKAMDFGLIWDGYDLIHTMSRVIGR